MCGRLGAARRISGPPFGQGIVTRVRGDAEGGIEERAVEVRAELRLRSAGSPLIDEDQIAAWGVGGPGLMVGVDGEGTAWAAVDINDGVREHGLLRAPDDDDRQLEPACAGVIVTPRDADRAAAQARTDLRRDTWQFASCLVEDRLRRLRLAVGMPFECKSDHEQQDADRPDVSQRGPRAEASQSGEPRPAATERPAQGDQTIKRQDGRFPCGGALIHLWMDGVQVRFAFRSQSALGNVCLGRCYTIRVRRSGPGESCATGSTRRHARPTRWHRPAPGALGIAPRTDPGWSPWCR